MSRKTFEAGAVRIRMECAEEIRDSDFFPLFRCEDGTPDYTVTVIRRPLPPRTGECVFRDAHRSRYLSEGVFFDYTYWSDALRREPVPYACAVKNGAQITLYVDYDAPLWDTMLFDAIGIADLLLEKGAALLHASFVGAGNVGLLFAGQKQAGKSTQARLWEAHKGAAVINGDRAAVRADETGFSAFGVPFCGSSRVCRNRSLPVKAIVFPEKGPENVAAPLPSAAAFKRLLGCLSYTEADPAAQARAVAFAEKLALECRCLSLVCRPDAGAVHTLARTLGL